MRDFALFCGAIGRASGAQKLRKQKMEFGAARTLARQLLELREAGDEIALVAAAKTDEPGGSSEKVGIELAGALDRSDTLAEHGVATANHVGGVVVAGSERQPCGSIAGIERDGFFEQGDGLRVVFEVVGRILAAEVEIVSLLVFGFGGGEFGWPQSQCRE